MGAGQLPPAQRKPPTADPPAAAPSGVTRPPTNSWSMVTPPRIPHHDGSTENRPPCAGATCERPPSEANPNRQPTPPVHGTLPCAPLRQGEFLPRPHLWRNIQLAKNRSNTPRTSGQSTRPTAREKALNPSGTPAQMQKAPRPATRQTKREDNNNINGADKSNTSNGKPRPHKGEAKLQPPPSSRQGSRPRRPPQPHRSRSRTRATQQQHATGGHNCPRHHCDRPKGQHVPAQAEDDPTGSSASHRQSPRLRRGSPEVNRRSGLLVFREN